MDAIAITNRRRSIRLKDYDYSQAGAYFVTVCTKNRECLFGEIVGSVVKISAMGRIVDACLHDLSRHYPRVQLDEFVIMPDHVHGIVFLMDRAAVVDAQKRAGLKPAPTQGAPNGPTVVGAGLRPAQVADTQERADLKPAPTEGAPDGFTVVGAGLRPAQMGDAQERAGLKPAPTQVAPNGSTVAGAGLKPAQMDTHVKIHPLSEIVRAFKSFSARRINELRHTPGAPVWQRNYYEHVIRDESELLRAREYIQNNPLAFALNDGGADWLGRH